MKTDDTFFGPIFDYSKDYCFEKIQGAISNWNSAGLGLTCLEEISCSIKQLKDLLGATGILASGRYWNVGNTVEEIEYPIAELLAYLKSPSANRLNAKDATIFLFFIEDKWRLLREMAAEIDSNIRGTRSG